jgi:hypothetical protein
MNGGGFKSLPIFFLNSAGLASFRNFHKGLTEYSPWFSEAPESRIQCLPTDIFPYAVLFNESS